PLAREPDLAQLSNHPGPDAFGESRSAGHYLEVGKAEMDDRADAKGIKERTNPDGPSQQPAKGQYTDFDDRAGQADRPAGARGQARHQAIARARTQARANIHAASDAIEQDRSKQHQAAQQ